jgi:CIC family chloride channel protein
MQRSSIYTLKLLRRGIDIYKGRAVNVLEPVSAREVVRSDVVTVSPETHLTSVVSQLLDHPGTTLFVTDEENHLLGVITADQIRPVMTDATSLDALLIAEDVMVEGEIPKVAATDSLADVMRHLGMYRGEMPVLEDGRLVGVIWPKDVIERYNSEIFKRDMARSMVSTVAPGGGSEVVPAAENAVVAEIPVPSTFVGKSIRDLNIRQDYGASVLMVKQLSDDGHERLQATPDANYEFRDGDVMLVMGPNEALRRLRTGTPST